jgi:hypothetical protein
VPHLEMTIIFAMNDREAQDYARTHPYVMGMLFNASDDYVGARCLILNGLFAGFVLGCQALEKLLKAILAAETGLELKRGHNPAAIFNKIPGNERYGVSQHYATLRRFYGHYLHRYHDNPDASQGASSAELVELDRIWLTLILKLPMPDEVKYRTKFFVDLCLHNPFWQTERWLKLHNTPLLAQIADIEKRYHEIRNQLYSPSRTIAICLFGAQHFADLTRAQFQHP